MKRQNKEKIRIPIRPNVPLLITAFRSRNCRMWYRKYLKTYLNTISCIVSSLQIKSPF